MSSIYLFQLHSFLVVTTADSQPGDPISIPLGILLMTLPLWLNVVFKTNGWEEGA